MRLLPMNMVRPGMRLGKAILSEDGHTLLGFRVELSTVLIEKLKKMGYEHLYIEDNRTDDIIVEDSLRDETRAALRQNLMRTFQLMQNTRGTASPSDRQLFAKTAQNSMNLILDDLQSRYGPSEDTIMLMDMQRKNFTLLEHFSQNAINVSVYATRIGMLEHLSRDDLETINLGALFHDIGNTQVPPKLLLKALLSHSARIC